MPTGKFKRKENLMKYTKKKNNNKNKNLYFIFESLQNSIVLLLQAKTKINVTQINI